MTAFKTFLLFLMLMPAFLVAQDIQGFIYENPGNTPVANANILIAGTRLGTVSGTDGSFTLKNKQTGKVKLVVSHIGYESTMQTLDVPLSGLKNIIFQLEPKNSEIAETVITATRTEKKINELPALDCHRRPATNRSRH
jgi:hypothetical protein